MNRRPLPMNSALSDLWYYDTYDRTHFLFIRLVLEGSIGNEIVCLCIVYCTLVVHFSIQFRCRSALVQKGMT